MRTKKTAFKPNLSGLASQEWGSVAETVAEVVADFDINMDKAQSFPYKEATLNSSVNEGKRRYYIEFWAYNESTKALKRKRLSKLPKKVNLNELNVKERSTVATYYMSIINRMLEQGYHFKALDQDDTDQIKLRAISEMTIPEAIEQAKIINRDLKGLAESTIGYYETRYSDFKSWIEQNGFADMKISELSAEIFMKYLDNVKRREVSNKTYNHYLGAITTMLNDLRKRDRSLFKENPLRDIDKLKTKAYKHAAYSNKQMKQIRNLIERTPDLKYVLRFIQFIYYSLARPNEIRNLRVGHIDLDNNRILIQGDNAKGDEEFCGIPPALREIIIEDNLLLNPPEYYVFGRDGKPGPKRIGTRHFYTKNAAILKELRLKEINRHYTLYSYKHSGALSLYSATKDIKLLQRQMRHKKVSQTEDYLRDLGVMAGYDGLNNWQGAI